MRIATASLVLCALGGCAGQAGPNVRCESPTDRSPALGSTFHLRYGGRATIAGEQLSLTFEKVLAESRCPVGVTCIWEGNARVLVTAERAPATPAALELNTSSRDAKEAAYQGYTVRLIGVQPAPERGRALPAPAYCVALSVTRKTE